MTTDELLAHLEGMIDRHLLRRVAAILFHRRAGFSANGMGVWKVDPEDVPEIGGRMAAVRGISHCYERPTYEDWPYSVFTMAHGRSKEECDAVLESIADEHGLHGDDRAVLYSSTEYKKIRLHYFTDDYAEWERQMTPAPLNSAPPALKPCAGTPAKPAHPLRVTKSDELYQRALRLLPGGVNSPVRAMGSIGRDPIFIASRLGLRADRRRRQHLRRLDLLLGTADPRARRSGGRRRRHRGGRTRNLLRRSDRGRGRAGGRGLRPLRIGRDAADGQLRH